MTTYTNRDGSHTHSFSGMPIYTSRDVPPGRAYALNGAIYARPDEIDQLLHQKFLDTIVNQPPTPPKAPMSTIDKIRAERREKREREELEAKFEAWEAAVGSAAEGDIYAFTWTPADKTYRYAAIHTDKRWFLTGTETCGYVTEDFIAWLINKGVDIQDFVFMEPLT
jgi:hypothetical protein